jgi:hypothetical protein
VISLASKQPPDPHQRSNISQIWSSIFQTRTLIVRSNAGHSTSCRHGTETNRNAPRDRLHGRLDIAVYRAALEGGWPGCRPEKLNATRRQVGRLRRSLPGGRRWSIDRLGRQRLRQFDAREFFHHPRIRADRSAPLPISERGAHGRFHFIEGF